ncbi:MAG: hypothetical protein EXQ89_07505 [Rhodospirillaceae bacterium]|nr:hypothetical protein [Rhodospirillaceae bacterium]
MSSATGFSPDVDEATASRRFASVGIEVRAVWRDLALKLADRLKERYGSKIHLYVRSPEELRAFREMNAHGRWDSVSNNNVIPEAMRATDLNETEVIARAQAFEKLSDTTFSLIACIHRHFGRGFSPGSFHYPRSKHYRDVSYIQMLHAHSELLDFWRREIEGKGLTILLQGDKDAAVMARAHGILYRRLDTSRYKNYWYWTPTEYYFNPAVERAYHAMTSWPESTIEQPYSMAVAKKTWFTGHSLATSLRRAAVAALSYGYWKLRGYQKARSFDFGEFVSFPLREHAAYRRMTGSRTIRLADLADRRFAYFPLHKEPETSLQLMSPEYFNQHAAILSIARDLPAGVVLAIKENLYTLGRRPTDFYDQIGDLKNVVFLHVGESGIDCARRAAFTVTITGTAGFEAAALGRPVITFGRHNMYAMAPHVMTVIDEAQIKGFIQRALYGVDAEKAWKDGSRFLAAAIACSFDMHNFALKTKGQTEPLLDAAVKNAFGGLIDSLGESDVNAVLQQAT